ncbi:MAG: capsule biosynthesis protein [Desulfobacteraceae bacterium]|nr:capsule biosynthesis protein [Desulfobacteraceae bacterium]
MPKTLTAQKLLKKIRKIAFPKKDKEDFGLAWQELLDAHRDPWEQARRTATDGPRILIATSTGGHGMAAPVESLLAMALTLRGANVSILLCDAFLPACSMATLGEIASLRKFIQSGLSNTKCPKCFKKGRSIFGPLGLPIHWYSQLLSPGARQKLAALAGATPLAAIPDFRLDGIAVGEHALAGALRFFAKGDLDGEAHAEAVLRRYFLAALITTFAVRELLSRQPFDCAVFHHGIYVPMGLIGEVARQEGVRVVNWIQAYRKNCFIFSHEDTYHHTLMTEPVDRWEDMPWNAAIENHLLDYLKSRWQGTGDWIRFHDRPDFDLEAIEAEVGVDFAKPCVGLLTNVIWDAQLHYPANAFANMLEWVLETIRHFAKRRDLQLLIRVHPAEITGFIPSRQKVVDEIRRAFASLPPNVFVIPPESRVSTYAAMSRCDCVIIYGTKTGVELTSVGIPVIVAGEAWIRNKGITLDAASRETYFDMLAQLPLGRRLDAATTERARKYAYHFFFRRMIPLAFFEPTGKQPPYRLAVRRFDALKPGNSRGLDTICDGILKGDDFIYPAERDHNG